LAEQCTWITAFEEMEQELGFFKGVAARMMPVAEFD
jgi:hypothetical protein